jgi:TadE-like protein
MHLPPTASRLSVGRSRQRGQSLVEIAIACIVLVPMFLMVALLGQYIHVRQQAQASARVAAWDASVSPEMVNRTGGLPSTAGEQARMRAMQFGKVDTRLTTRTAGGSTLDDPMLTTFAGRDLVLARNVTLDTYKSDASPAPMSKVLDKLGSLAGGIGLDGIPPDKRGLITADVSARTEHVLGRDGRTLAALDPLASMDLTFHGRTVLLADAWDARGPGENTDGKGKNDIARTVRHTIKPLAPFTAIPDSLSSGFESVMNVISAIPLVGTVFGMKDFVIGKTAPDVVPADKLVRYGKK